MDAGYSVSLQKIIDSHSLEIIYLPKAANDILITTNEINRPGIVQIGRASCRERVSPYV